MKLQVIKSNKSDSAPTSAKDGKVLRSSAKKYLEGRTLDTIEQPSLDQESVEQPSLDQETVEQLKES